MSTATSKEHSRTANTPPVWESLRNYVSAKVNRLQSGYLRQVPTAKADLAALRGTDPVRDDRILMAWESVFDDAPAELIGSGDTPTKPERVIVAGLHLYAVHQQSRTIPMHVQGAGLGTAIRKLANPSDAESREKPVMRRYHALSTATEFPEMMHHLRGLISQMRASNISLDYAQLSSDLYSLMDERTRTRVRLAWARDLTRRAKPEDADTTSAEATT